VVHEIELQVIKLIGKLELAINPCDLALMDKQTLQPSCQSDSRKVVSPLGDMYLLDMSVSLY
jgi:hypothetical protein